MQSSELGRYNEDYQAKVQRALSNGNLSVGSGSLARGIVQLNPRLTGGSSKHQTYLPAKRSQKRKKSNQTNISASIAVPSSNVAMIHQTLAIKPNLKNVYSSIQSQGGNNQSAHSQAPRTRANGPFISDSISQGGQV